MGNPMHRRTFILSTAVLSLAACAPGIDSNPLSRDVRRSLRFASIEVNTAGAAFESARATEFSSALGPDLRAALQEEFSDRMGNGTYRMIVDVARLNVAGSAATSFGNDTSRLLGGVRILDGAGATIATYSVQVQAGAAADTTTGAIFGAVVNTANRYYRRLVGDFAEDTRELVLG